MLHVHCLINYSFLRISYYEYIQFIIALNTAQIFVNTEPLYNRAENENRGGINNNYCFMLIFNASFVSASQFVLEYVTQCLG